MPVLEQIERDKGVKKEEILKMIESSLVSAYRKHYGKIMNVIASIDPETAEIKAFLVKKVVEEVQNPQEEISREEAKGLKLDATVGAEVQISVATEEFSRIAAQIAKQIIVQKIREVERTTLFDEFSGKEMSMASGSVHRYAERNLIIDLGRAEAILPVREQVRRERFNLGERLKVLVLKVDRGSRGPQILVSRAHPDIVKRLMELEVPEINEKIVEIVAVVRDPGFRSKVAVRSNNSKVDPVGTCVGVKGSRIRPVIDELRGERIDLIPWSMDPDKFVAQALSPAKTLSVNLHKDAKTAEVLVSNDMYTLAIGRNGQNVRLASQLTGWTIDVKSEFQKKEETAKNVEAAQKELAHVEGVGPKTAEVLIKSGWITVQKLAGATVEQLTTLQGIGEKTAEKIIESAAAVQKERESAAKAAPAPDERPAGEETPDEKPRKEKRPEKDKRAETEEEAEPAREPTPGTGETDEGKKDQDSSR
ncbi:MAG: transcription termination factor NusA [Elusimicrobia bacterium RIFCSPLOWO2_01_FULL_64_13]|nr:MAG: transcription termination factor NusA [Elusimicrobia bacterium RIFCSPLOWO2_01_FULL_64_13]